VITIASNDPLTPTALVEVRADIKPLAVTRRLVTPAGGVQIGEALSLLATPEDGARIEEALLHVLVPGRKAIVIFMTPNGPRSSRDPR